MEGQPVRLGLPSKWAGAPHAGGGMSAETLEMSLRPVTASGSLTIVGSPPAWTWRNSSARVLASTRRLGPSTGSSPLSFRISSSFRLAGGVWPPLGVMRKFFHCSAAEE